MDPNTTQALQQVTPKEALNVLNQVIQTVSATPAVHTQIQVAFATLVAFVQKHDPNQESANEPQVGSPVND